MEMLWQCCAFRCFAEAMIAWLSDDRRGGSREMLGEAKQSAAGAERGTRGDGKALLSPGKQMQSKALVCLIQQW